MPTFKTNPWKLKDKLWEFTYKQNQPSWKQKLSLENMRMSPAKMKVHQKTEEFQNPATKKNKASTNNTGFHKHSDVTQKWGNQGASTPQNVNMWQLRMLDVFNASLKVG